jgi:hypothetical protein
MFNCPVCGFDDLSKPPADYSICPCCGTEFGYSDAGPEPQRQIHASLRKNWIDRGARWHSQYMNHPPLWNPWVQLFNARLSAEIPWLQGITVSIPITYTKVDPVYLEPVERKLAYA